MLTKPVKTMTHRKLSLLKKRIMLTKEEEKLLQRLTLGYEGEMTLFNLLTNHLKSSPFTLYDLSLEISGSIYQIDCLLIFQTKLILLEVKNYYGDFIINKNKWYTLNEQEVRNPCHQLNRTELLLRQKLQQDQRFPLKIKSYLIFVHPEFYLYNASPSLPAIFPAQLKRFIQTLETIPCHLTDDHENLATMLRANHQHTSPYERDLQYNFSQLDKGLTCNTCPAFMEVRGFKIAYCPRCQRTECLEETLFRNIREFAVLFPQKKITVSKIAKWINYTASNYLIRKQLLKNSTFINKGRSSYYILNDN